MIILNTLHFSALISHELDTYQSCVYLNIISKCKCSRTGPCPNYCSSLCHMVLKRRGGPPFFNPLLILSRYIVAEHGLFMNDDIQSY